MKQYQSPIITWEDILKYVNEKRTVKRKELAKKFKSNNSNLYRKLRSLSNHGLIIMDGDLIRTTT